MALPARKPATYDDLFDLPDTLIGEIVAGVLYASPRPAIAHARAASDLHLELGDPFRKGRRGPGGWWILFEPELHLSQDILVPDLAGWRRERLPELPDAAAFTLAPCWACEVLSPSTARLDRVEKMGVYRREGVQWLWLLDPVGRTLEAYRIEGENYVLIGTWGGNVAARVEPFDAVEIDFAEIWGREPEPTEE